jgi:hypothetical protein
MVFQSTNNWYTDYTRIREYILQGIIMNENYKLAYINFEIFKANNTVYI